MTSSYAALMVALAATTLAQDSATGQISSGPGSAVHHGGAGGLNHVPPQFVQYLPYSLEKLNTLYIAHGVLASIAFVIFFPAGSILLRVLPGRLGVVMHVVFQALAHILFAIGFGIGIYYTHKIKFGQWALIHNTHPLIGVVCFVLLFIQPVLGWVHHRFFKKVGKRTFWTHAHLWLGRGLIILGITNGGLGLKLAGTASPAVIAYGVIAGVFGVTWLVVAVICESRRGKAEHSPPAYVDESSAPARDSKMEMETRP